MELKIIGCSDPQMWYSDKIGQVVPLLFKIEEGYMSREPAGFANIVLEKDAEIVK